MPNPHSCPPETSPAEPDSTLAAPGLWVAPGQRGFEDRTAPLRIDPSTSGIGQSHPASVVSRERRFCWRLRLFCDSRHPGLGRSLLHPVTPGVIGHFGGPCLLSPAGEGV